MKLGQLYVPAAHIRVQREFGQRPAVPFPLTMILMIIVAHASPLTCTSGSVSEGLSRAPCLSTG